MAQRDSESSHKEHLDHITLDIELILISVIQGVALTFLATSAVDPISKGEVGSWLYIISGFLLILLFWSQAIIHAISFIKWPLDLTHTFLYFLVSFAQIILFTNITQPLQWFIAILFFLFCATVLYVYDYFYISRSKGRFTSAKQQSLLRVVLKRQLFEIRTFLPLGFLYNGMAVVMGLYASNVFSQWQEAFIFGQVVISAIILFQSMHSLKERSELILSI